MKILLATFALLISTASNAQTSGKVILTTGTNGYVTIQQTGSMPQDYTRGYIMPVFVKQGTDTLMGISYSFGYPAAFIPYQHDTMYQNGDAGNANFPSADSLYRWTRAHLNKYQ